MPPYTGGCLCGAVRIEITAAPYRVGICHCLDCRKRQGALFHSFAVFPLDAVTVTGETREFKTRSFCPTCGSPLFDRWDDEFELHAGCLDFPDQLTPTYESWTIRREAWLPPFDVAKRYERDRTAKGRTES
ncbi:GFA family protein [Pelagibius sp. 7325]|uniref:GFA family protein n=1 Tax=Pelagibius sp. 7325 TaxID=3131994 RepID=UPI0030EECF84